MSTVTSGRVQPVEESSTNDDNDNSSKLPTPPSTSQIPTVETRRDNLDLDASNVSGTCTPTQASQQSQSSFPTLTQSSSTLSLDLTDVDAEDAQSLLLLREQTPPLSIPNPEVEHSAGSKRTASGAVKTPEIDQKKITEVSILLSITWTYSLTGV